MSKRLWWVLSLKIFVKTIWRTLGSASFLPEIGLWMFQQILQKDYNMPRYEFLEAQVGIHLRRRLPKIYTLSL